MNSSASSSTRSAPYIEHVEPFYGECIATIGLDWIVVEVVVLEGRVSV